MFIKYKFFPKLWNKNKTKGIAINPENETALAITRYSFTKMFWFLSRTWKITRKNKDTKITEIMFVKRFLKDLFSMKYSLKNSTGINKTNNEINKVMNDQNNPCPFQLINTWFTNPEDSKNK